MDDSANNYDLIIFLGEQGEERHEIRKEWYNGTLYYSIVDMIAALKVSQKPPRQYWAQLKEQVKDEGFVEAKSKIVQLRLKAQDEAGRAGKGAREIAESTLGESIVSSENYMHPITDLLIR